MATIKISQPIPIGSDRNLFYLTNEEVETLRILELIIFDVKQMRDNGVFDFKGGEAIIHRNIQGELKKIEIKTTRYMK